MKIIGERGQRVNFLTNFAVLGISLYVAFRQEYVFKKTSVFEYLMIESFTPVQRSITYVKGTISSFFDNYIGNINASKDNYLLKKNISMLEDRLFHFEELGRENQRLKSLLNFSETVVGKKVLAQIVAMDSSSDYRVYRINKGSADGISIQSPVVTGEGLVGYVFRLTNHFADILTILDSNNRVDALISRIRSHGIVEGESRDTCVMKYVTRTDPVILNDLVLTSGLGNLYPRGIRVGLITRIEKDNYGVVQELEITPSVDFDSLEEVIVLVTPGAVKRKKEWKALDFTEGIGN